MPQSKERHALYVSVRRKLQREHPEWNNREINAEVKARLSVLPKAREPRKFATNGRYRNTHIHFPELSNWNGTLPVTKEELFEFQGGRCAICGEKPERLDYDHDYSTGLPRGLVCHSCNLLLGRYENGKYTGNVEALRSKIERFLANTPVSQVQDLKTNGSQDILSGSREWCTGSQPTERYMLSYSRNKYQFVLYTVSPSGSRSIVRSLKKNEKLQLGPCEIELTWGPDE